MKNLWFSFPRRTRLTISLGLVVLGVLLVLLDVSGALYFLPILGPVPPLLIGLGLSSFAYEFVFAAMFPERFVKPVPEDMAQLDLAQHWVQVPPEKFEAVFNVLAKAFGGAFEIQKLHLLAAAAHLHVDHPKEFPLTVHLDGAPASVNVRLVISAGGLIGCGFFAAPKLLARIKDVLAPILT